SAQSQAARGTAQETHRVRVSELPPPRQPDRVRESGDSPLVPEREPQGSPEHGGRHPRSFPDRRKERSVSQSALGRTAAAGGSGARGDRESAGGARGRTDR